MEGPFDVSEWMFLRLLESLDGRTVTLAMLCEAAVGRKVLSHAWEQEISIGQAEMHRIDARENFGSTVDAGLLVWSLTPTTQTRDYITYDPGSNQPGTAHSF